MNRSRALVLGLAFTTIASTSVAALALLRSSDGAADLRAKAASLDAYCRRLRIHYESERIELANVSYREKLLARMRDEVRVWKPEPVDICLRTPVDWVRRNDCIYSGDFDCLIASDLAIEAAIPVL